MGQTFSTLKNEQGSVLVVALMILVLLTIIGISASTTSTIDIQIAGNEKFHKISFYAADGGTQAGIELLEQNVSCPLGFSIEPKTIGNAEVTNDDFWQDENPPTNPFPSDTERDIHIPISDAVPHTNLTIFGNTQLSTGSAIQMAAGYEGKGKGAGGAGGYIIYDIYSQHKGQAKSESIVNIQWRHLIGQEGTCMY